MIESKRKQFLCKRCLTILTICCILAYLFIFAIFNIYGFERYCNADTYADTMIAKRMWDQKTLFPQGWIFCNQYYVVATPVLSALLYGIIGNVNIAMVFATEIMTVLMLLSFFWMLRAITKDMLSSLVCCLLFISSMVALNGPWDLWPQYLFLQASYYACYTFTLFFVFGDYIRAFQSTKPRLAAWGLSLFLCFATGIQSLRQTVMTVLPILCYELFLAFRRILCHKKPWSKENINTLIRALSYGACNLAGIITIKLLAIPSVSIFGEVQPASFQSMGQSLPAVWQAISDITGLNYIFNSTHTPKLIILYIMLLLVVFAVSAILWFARIKRAESPLEICWVLCLIGICGVLLSTVVLNVILRSVYIYMWYPLVAFSGLMLLKKLSTRPKYIAVLLICVFSLINLNFSYLPEARRTLRGGADDAEQMCQWAMYNDYKYVYGDYWSTAPYIAVYSEGKVKAGSWFPTSSVYTAQQNTNAQDIYGAEENEKAIYVFTAEDEEYGLLVAEERGVSLTKVAQFGRFIAYTSPVPLMETQ